MWVGRSSIVGLMGKQESNVEEARAVMLRIQKLTDFMLSEI